MPVAADWTPPLCSVSVDVAVLTVRGGRLHVLLVRRGAPPYVGEPALPGGFVGPTESVDDAAARELAEETGLEGLGGPGGPAGGVHLEQLFTYGDPGRDPRGRVVSVAHLVLAPDLGHPVAGTDASEASWVPVAEALAAPLAFDHARILRDALERARSKLEYTALATSFCPPEFTVGELRRVYETVWGVELDPRNFHRKVTRTEGFLAPTGATTNRDGGRPAQLFRRGPVTTLVPPLMRPA